MYRENAIAVTIPMYNEEKLIEKVVRKIPEYVDYIFVIDDGSTDESARIVENISQHNQKVTLIKKTNQGVGSAILTGYNKALEKKVDILSVVSGDNQMDTKYLHLLLDQIIDNGCDFAKGNRLSREYKNLMPKKRRFGNEVFSLITKSITGYHRITDPLNGYTCTKAEIFARLNQKWIKRNYLFELSFLKELNIIKAHICEIKIPPNYGEEKSNLKEWRFFFQVMAYMFPATIQRLFRKMFKR